MPGQDDSRALLSLGLGTDDQATGRERLLRAAPPESAMAARGYGPAALGGAVAGAAGTLAMDLLWYWRARRSGSRPSFREWETAQGTDSFERASAPAKSAQRLAGLVGVNLPDSSARVATNVMHWGMGVGWGVVYGVLAQAAGPQARPYVAAAFPITVFTSSYVALGAMGVYKPIWQYPAGVVARDLTAHLLYGATTAAVFQLTDRAR